MCYNKLKEYSKIILKIRKFHTVILAIETVFAAIFLALTFLEIRLVPVLIFFIVSMIFSIKAIRKYDLLFSELLRIEKNNAINRTYPLEIFYPKITLLTVPEIKTVATPPTYCFGIQLTDSDKNKYYYFFEELAFFNKVNTKTLYGKFDGKIGVRCFENTSIVKTIENDPHFIHIKYGSLKD